MRVDELSRERRGGIAGVLDAKDDAVLSLVVEGEPRFKIRLEARLQSLERLCVSERSPIVEENEEEEMMIGKQ